MEMCQITSRVHNYSDKGANVLFVAGVTNRTLVAEYAFHYAFANASSLYVD